MKVKNMIEQLSKLPQDAEVLASIDEEGNGFGTIFDISPANDKQVVLWQGANVDVEWEDEE